MKFVESIRNSLHTLLQADKNVILYGEDLADPYGGAFKVSKGLSTSFPKQVYNTPISESTIIGMASGMAMGGIKPIVEIMFGDFLTLGIDQLLNHAVKYSWMYNNQVQNPIVIRAAMGGGRGYGPTHSQSMEALLSTIPMLTILAPSIYHNPGKILEYAVKEDDSVKIFSEYKLLYPKELINEQNIRAGLQMRITEDPYPIVTLSNAQFEQPELLIITFGGNGLLAEEVLFELLMEEEMAVEALLPACIKPFPWKSLTAKIEKCAHILIIEESALEHGWGSEIAAYIAEHFNHEAKIVKRVGATNHPIPSAMELEAQALPSKQKILNTIKEMF